MITHEKEISIEFCNKSKNTARVYWLTPDGGEQLYRTLAPGECYTQRAWPAQKWQMREVSVGPIVGTYTAQAEANQVFEIQASGTPANTNQNEASGGAATPEYPQTDEATMAWLAVQLVFRGVPIGNTAVSFFTLTGTYEKGEPIGTTILTNDQGIAQLPEMIAPGVYACEIDQQPMTTVNTVLKANEPIVLTLPIGEFDLQIFDPPSPFEEEIPTTNQEITA